MIKHLVAAFVFGIIGAIIGFNTKEAATLQGGPSVFLAVGFLIGFTTYLIIPFAIFIGSGWKFYNVHGQEIKGCSTIIFVVICIFVIFSGIGCEDPDKKETKYVMDMLLEVKSMSLKDAQWYETTRCK